MPRVSVVIATYNWATVLPYSIGSVLDQTFTDFELLVVGDGCTDESAEVVSSFRDSRVQWVNLPHNTGHQSGPNNEGQRRARGEIVAYLGHDDLWLPRHLETLVEPIEAGAPGAHTSALRVHPAHGPSVTPREGWEYRRGAWVIPTSMALARAVLTDIGGWRPPRETRHLDPEADLWVRVFDVAGPPVWVPRLTCVKLSAAQRRDVYRTRPCFEQDHWLRTIRAAPDPEAAMLASTGEPYALAVEAPRVRPHTRAWRSTLWLRRRLRVRERLGIAVRAETRIQRSQRFKGL